MAYSPKGDNLAEAHVGVGKNQLRATNALGRSLLSTSHLDLLFTTRIRKRAGFFQILKAIHDAAVGIESCRFVYRQEQDLDL